MTRDSRRFALTALLAALVPAAALALDPAPAAALAAPQAQPCTPHACACSHAATMNGAANKATPRTDPAIERELDQLRSQPG